MLHTKDCQPELVEGGISIPSQSRTRLRQAQADRIMFVTLTIQNIR
jgi:hypothetical protein